MEFGRFYHLSQCIGRCCTGEAGITRDVNGTKKWYDNDFGINKNDNVY